MCQKIPEKLISVQILQLPIDYEKIFIDKFVFEKKIHKYPLHSFENAMAHKRSCVNSSKDKSPRNNTSIGSIHMRFVDK